jgi:hypothetical protein
MGHRDFLHKGADTPLVEYYRAVGAVCSLSTNSEQILESARRTFVPLPALPPHIDFSIRLWTESSRTARPPWPKPYIRGLDHLVFAGFDQGSSMLIDLRTSRVVGRVSQEMAADTQYWQTIIFPMMLTVIGASAGVAELHCACVAHNNHGLLLAGSSGAGKSTLALALSQVGLSFLSDDRTFCSLVDGEVQAWSLPTRLKLRPDAVRFFEEVRNKQLESDWSGEPAYWLQPEQIPGVTRLRRCRPIALIFLERAESSQSQWFQLSSTDALRRLGEDLVAESPTASAKRLETVRKVVTLPCWLLRYGRPPRTVAQEIAGQFCTADCSHRSTEAATAIQPCASL